MLVSVEACGRCQKAYRGEREGKTFLVGAGGRHRGLKRPQHVGRHPGRGKDPVVGVSKGSITYLSVFANGATLNARESR